MTFSPARDIPDLTAKTVLVTRDTSGIGKATVLSFAIHSPAPIYSTGRNARAGPQILEELHIISPGTSAIFIQCDLIGPRQSIWQAFATNFTSTQLDVFVANAGIMAVLAALTNEGFEIQFGANYVALLKATSQGNGPARIVVVSSFGHTMAPPSDIEFDKLKTSDAGTTWQRYGQSKLADIFLTKSMAKRFPQITSPSVHPGFARIKLSVQTKFLPLKMLFSLLKYTPLYKTAEAGAYNTLWAATVPKDKVENGSYHEPVGKVPLSTPNGSLGMSKIVSDEMLADRLWDWTEKELEDVAQ
ncbi:NAD(P)-binding protein [Polychaeton citri CBS 116435]|uniref:NAD(P)-binding protein n=1 Tax=Polychaeton citri CBS 116435 TaxID=1314669 RepID=A0A9P4Q141_9PEZI|nr:NAD(P)-binding protein [Polychaeton citri CBS 116435]